MTCHCSASLNAVSGQNVLDECGFEELIIEMNILNMSTRGIEDIFSELFNPGISIRFVLEKFDEVVTSEFVTGSTEISMAMRGTRQNGLHESR